MNEILKVRAAQGLKVPMAGKPYEYITDQEAVCIPDAAYYRRCIAYGDLIVVRDDDTPKKGSK